MVILNSSVYGKASVKLDDCNSLQLIGPNNVGKSTLIYALNFLFIIDGKKMTFSGNRTGDKETLHHYFPSPISSYIIFEIFKQRYYCILLRRNQDSEIEYYKIDSEYKEEFFLEDLDGQQRVLKIDEVEEKLLTSGFALQHFKNKRDVFEFIYQRGKRNNAVVWLDDKVVSDGLSNNFSKVYRYLINSKLITNKTLKEALIIADNRDKEGVSFSHKSRKDINDLLRINDEIKVLNSIKEDFFAFREVVKQYKAKTKTVGELVYAFEKQYGIVRPDLEVRVIKKNKDIQELQVELTEILKPEESKLNQNIGMVGQELKTIIEDKEKLQRQIDHINGLDSLEFLEQALENLDNKRREIEAKLTRIESQKLSSHQVEGKVSALTKAVDQKEKQIANYSQQLIHRIAKDQRNKELLNFILSEEFAGLSNDFNIELEVSEIGGLMQLFDGRIKLPGKLEPKQVASIQTLKSDLDSLKQELEEYQKLLPIVQDFENFQKSLRDKKRQIADVNEKIQKVKSKPGLVAQLREKEQLFQERYKGKEKLEKDLRILNENILRKTSASKIISEEKSKLEARIQELNRQKTEVEDISVEILTYDTEEGLEQIFVKIKMNNRGREELKSKKERSFEKLKYPLKSSLADENAFIAFVEDEIASLQGREKSIDNLLQAIATQFSNPAVKLLQRYHDYRAYIYNKFNSKLSKIKISDIESLKIELVGNEKVLSDLKKISSIQNISNQMLLDFEQSENLRTLNKYLDSGKKIDFEELFDIELHLTKDGKEKKVDLREQVESDGTDRVIRLIIIMSIINRLAIFDKENKIVIFIDEIATIDGNNRRELFKFCQEHNFIPICASPDETILDGFDKYYLLLRPRKGSKVNINENQHVMRQSVVATS